MAGKFAYLFRYFGNLEKDEQERLLGYELTVYFCEGTDSEKLEWFKTINIAGEELTEQELLNAVRERDRRNRRNTHLGIRGNGGRPHHAMVQGRQDGS